MRTVHCHLKHENEHDNDNDEDQRAAPTSDGHDSSV